MTEQTPAHLVVIFDGQRSITKNLHCRI